MGDVGTARSLGLTMLAAALGSVDEVGVVSVVSGVPPACAYVHSDMSTVKVAVTAEMELRMWCVAGGSAIVRSEAASMSRERAVVDVDSSLGSDVVYIYSCGTCIHSFHSHSPWRSSSNLLTFNANSSY